MASDPSTAPTSTFGPRPVVLDEPPALFSVACGRTQAQRDRGGIAQDLAYGAAALRAAWPSNAAWPAPMRPRPWQPGTDLSEYGMEVYEGLRKATRGTVLSSDLQTACYAALHWALVCGLTEAEVQAAEDFAAGQEE